MHLGRFRRINKVEKLVEAIGTLKDRISRLYSVKAISFPEPALPFSSERETDVSILGADQKDRSLWKTEC